jgi:uncharacterized membrane protein
VRDRLDRCQRSRGRSLRLLLLLRRAGQILRDVEKVDETHFSLTSVIGGEEHRTVLQIVLRVPERRIAWQAISDNFPRGVVVFEPLSDRTTEITVRLRSSIEPATLAKVTRDYLTNFKRVVEEA